MERNRFKLLIISLLLNGFGNALAISTLVGSVIWTASGQRLATLFNLSIGAALTFYGIVIIFLSCLLDRKIDWKKSIGNFIFMIVFSYLVDGISVGLNFLGVGQLPFILRLFLNIVAVLIISAAISIYQKANVVLHPNDEFMLIIRQRFTNNNAAKAQLIAYVVPIFVIITTYLSTGKLEGIGIGTLVSFVAQGFLIDLSDRLLFKEKELSPQIISSKG